MLLCKKDVIVVCLFYGGHNTTADFQIEINKMGIGISQSVEDITYYNQYYIRTIPFAFAIACVGTVIVFAPEAIPIIGLAFA